MRFFKYVGSFFCVLLCAIVLSWICNGSPMTGIDDAHIFFNYAENIVKGLGITYSNNGVPVEGCTSLLWMGICALNFYIGANESGVFLFAIVFLIMAQWLWVRFLRKMICNEIDLYPAIILYGSLVLSSPGYITWMSITLMDVALWGFFVAWLTNVLYDALGDRNVSFQVILGFLVAPTIRPESFYAVFVFLFIIFILRKHAAKRHLLCGVAFLFSGIALTLFRIWYFGYPLPNTYYAKVSPSVIYNIKCGAVYAGLFISTGLIPTVFAVNVFFVIRKIISCCSFRLQKGYVMWVWALALMCMPVLTGGDHFELHRFYQPFYPLMCALLVYGMFELKVFDFLFKASSLKSIKAFLFIIGITVILFGWSGRGSWLFAIIEGSSLKHEFLIAEEGRSDGLKLNRLFEGLSNYPVVGTVTAGGVARTYKGRVVDIMGLNEIKVAHYPGDRKGMKNHAAFEPNIFNQLGCDALRALPIDNMFLKDLTLREQFVREWKCVKLSLKEDPECAVTIMIKKILIDKIINVGRCQVTEAYIWNGSCWVHVI